MEALSGFKIEKDGESWQTETTGELSIIGKELEQGDRAEREMGRKGNSSFSKDDVPISTAPAFWSAEFYCLFPIRPYTLLIVCFSPL